MGTTTHFFISAAVACTPASPNYGDSQKVFENATERGTQSAYHSSIEHRAQADKVFGYRYHASDAAPYIIQCLMGEVPSVRDLPRIAPLRSADGRPPRGGVEGLTFSQDATGARRMEYSYEGKAYYIRYKPSGKLGCYRFETRTVTDDGVVKEGEYCR